MTSPDHWGRCSVFSYSSNPFCAAVIRLSPFELEGAVNAGKSNKMVIVAGIYGGVTSSLRLLLKKFAEERGSAAHCDFSFHFS